MKTKCVYDDYIMQKIEELDRKLIEIEKEYIERYLSTPFDFGIHTLEMDYRNDFRVKNLERQKAFIYERAVPKILITAENEEEKKMLKERLLRNDGNI